MASGSTSITSKTRRSRLSTSSISKPSTRWTTSSARCLPNFDLLPHSANQGHAGAALDPRRHPDADDACYISSRHSHFRVLHHAAQALGAEYCQKVLTANSGVQCGVCAVGVPIVTNLALEMAPVTLQWDVQITLKRKIQVCFLMLLGLIATVSSVLRNAFQSGLTKPDFTCEFYCRRILRGHRAECFSRDDRACIDRRRSVAVLWHYRGLHPGPHPGFQDHGGLVEAKGRKKRLNCGH